MNEATADPKTYNLTKPDDDDTIIKIEGGGMIHWQISSIIIDFQICESTYTRTF